TWVAATVRSTGMVKTSRGKAALASALGLAAIVGAWGSLESALAASLQTGLLDPIPLLQRSVNLVMIPLVDAAGSQMTPTPRHYEGAWLIGTVLLVVLLLLPRFPRFYCRFLCPLGALFGILGRFALWRVGQAEKECVQCGLCSR
ncbi:MAG TPA: 4Fe-4S ferredoxin, partial [Syntrophobacteraceae bacterium]|nr:4Fe-4S ferredoxin [Syntrophobacteraceae bacterium]